MGQDSSAQLQEQVKTAINEKTPLSIQGSGSKHFYGNPVSSSASTLSTTAHHGIINYQPSELVITARAGTPLQYIEAELKKNQQCLPFEPPYFSNSATLGGTIATGLSGPSRPFKGACRDAVLGCRIINGHGEILRFGGEVVKNVAGYDASRLLTGSLGTLGVFLDLSIKVLPLPQCQKTFVQSIDKRDVVNFMNQLRRSTLPLSGIAYVNHILYTRVEGLESALSDAHKILGNNTLDDGIAFWLSVKEQTHDFFQPEKNLWQCLVPPATNHDTLLNDAFIDWAGGIYWISNNQPCHEIRQLVSELGGHAILFRRNKNNQTETFPPLAPGILSLHKNMKHAFDPNGIFNHKKMYAEF